MCRITIFSLMFILSFVLGCKQTAIEDNIEIENTEMNLQKYEEEVDGGCILTEQEAKQALLKRFGEIRVPSDDSVLHGHNNPEEKDYRDFLEGYPEGKFDYNYEDYVDIEIITKVRGGDADEDEEFEFAETFECNLKKGLFRKTGGNHGYIFGRFRKSKSGEWITTIEGVSFSGSTAYGQ